MNRSNKPTILIIDDDANNLGVLHSHLEMAGYEVLVAEDGQDGLAIASAARPALILLDVLMPGLDGFETCRQLKANPATRPIPVIFMTALSDVENTVQGFSAGGVDYITKPFRQAELLARIATHLQIKQLQAELRVQNEQLQAQNAALQAALAQVKQLSGLLPICAGCKKIRNDAGYWQEVEGYIREHSTADFTHGICPTCIDKLYPDL